MDGVCIFLSFFIVFSLIVLKMIYQKLSGHLKILLVSIDNYFL